MRRKLTLFLIASAVGCSGTPSGTPTPISSTASQTQTSSSTPSPSTQPDPVASATLVWTQGGLPTGLARRIAGLAGVTHSVSVVDGTVWLVAIFKRWGFTWGGNWMRPDGMHFEFQCFPPGLGPSGLPSGLTCPPGGAIWPPT